MLDNPDAHYYNYYQYYKRRVSPKVDVRIVIAGTILIISLVQVNSYIMSQFRFSFQYISAHHKFNEAVGYLLTQPKYRLRAMEIAKERGLLDEENAKSKARRKKDKVCGLGSDVAQYDDRLEFGRTAGSNCTQHHRGEYRYQVSESSDQYTAFFRGGYKKPSIFDLFLFRIIFLPYTIAKYLYWCSQWIWRYNICRQEYDEEAKLHIIRKYLNMSLSQFTVYLR